MWRGITRRRFPRVNRRCLIKVTEKGSRKHFVTETENIGVGGICVTLNEALELFSEVEIELTLKDDGPPIKCRGNVVWMVKSGEIKEKRPVIKFDTGIEFADIPEADKARIEKLVDNTIRMEAKKERGPNK